MRARILRCVNAPVFFFSTLSPARPHQVAERPQKPFGILVTEKHRSRVAVSAAVTRQRESGGAGGPPSEPTSRSSTIIEPPQQTLQPKSPVKSPVNVRVDVVATAGKSQATPQATPINRSSATLLQKTPPIGVGEQRSIVVNRSSVTSPPFKGNRWLLGTYRTDWSLFRVAFLVKSFLFLLTYNLLNIGIFYRIILI